MAEPANPAGPAGPAGPVDPANPDPTAETQKLSDQLEEWLGGEGERTLGSLVTAFGEKSFAILFVVLLGVPALPLPTGGATHVFEVIAALLALELIIGRRQVWLPKRWQRLELAGARQQKFVASLTKLIRRLERLSRPRLTFLFGHRLSNAVFGLLVIGGAAGAFFAPPFTGLDTLPALGVVILALGVLLEDALVVAVGIAIGILGVVLEIVAGAAALRGIRSIL
ncbi:MAG: exopolysaccharide biosynthesis protein [Solirubrobacteraceae bacterium]